MNDKIKSAIEVTYDEKGNILRTEQCPPAVAEAAYEQARRKPHPKDSNMQLRVEQAGKRDIDGFFLTVYYPKRSVMTMNDKNELVPTGESAPPIHFFVGQQICVNQKAAAETVRFLQVALMDNSYVREDGVRIFQVLDENDNIIEIEGGYTYKEDV